jgi:hypothetical protein
LSFTPAVLDAVATLRPTETSKVVETDQGFEILRRLEPPELQLLSGARIVIGYVGADRLEFLGGPRATRTRDEAFALASTVARELQNNPERFRDYVLRYSEHPDAARGGDFGTWSSREPTELARELVVLQGLDTGRVAPPLDSPVGFEVIQRTKNVPRVRYAMTAIKMAFDLQTPEGEPGSKEKVYEEISELSQQLNREPSRFDEFRDGYCCSRVEVWRNCSGPRAG